MTEPEDLLGHIRYHLSRSGPLQGRRIVVSAGGTQEPLDPVRILTNRSSGKQGVALAQAALDAGADVILVAAPVTVPIPIGVDHLPVRTAGEMAQAVLASCQDADALLMAAAVADFRPAQVDSQKIKKHRGAPTLTLEPTTDILAAVAQQRLDTGYPKFVVGFAAETQDLLANAHKKLKAKSLDLIVANDVSAADAGFVVDTNRVTLISAAGEPEEFPLLNKAEVAKRVIDRASVQILGSGGQLSDLAES
jgi:phosphopantothenoylcysteine decarboxylase/phosphopantothenate--cysteine ligase